ncbi:MAG TPA: 3-oxoacyl-[acyl-carrier-protein] reductase [Candidatus Hydrogenedentes bacterium]|nr:3-oxoacyl-[acyl-carrier-protein] reductase [Candidatus Hydrogenedentota bacterium]HOS03079.1 3-oxoacyl-[acyl-carrier-protein] reductase [Candidatus Hydrogenedentota bacterium]
MNEFQDKVVLITGGTRGIGRACAAAFAQAGARVAICGRALDTTVRVAAELGANVQGYAADVADPASVDSLIAEVSDRLGPIDILINNAGIARDGLILRMKNEDWDAVLAANLSGAFYCCRAVARGMIKQRHGRIINISSVVGLHGQAGQSNYAAAKAGLVGLSKALAHEFASRNITVNTIAPGYIETDMTAGFTEEMRAAALARIPLKRSGACEEIAAAVLFLASDGAGYITGAVVPIDGGLGM